MDEILKWNLLCSCVHLLSLSNTNSTWSIVYLCSNVTAALPWDSGWRPCYVFPSAFRLAVGTPGASNFLDIAAESKNLCSRIMPSSYKKKISKIKTYKNLGMQCSWVAFLSLLGLMIYGSHVGYTLVFCSIINLHPRMERLGLPMELMCFEGLS